MRAEQGGRTLTNTALVHVAYLRLVDANRVDVRRRAHFHSLAAKFMRQILLDNASRRRAAKRGDGAIRADLGAVAEAVGSESRDRAVIALGGALDELALVDEHRARAVALRYFAA